MPRPLWKGAISFGMVSIPIKLYTATEEKDVRFNLLHRTDHSRIKQKRFCAEEDIELEQQDIVRGYEISPGRYVLVEDDDLEKVPVSTTRAIEITDFVSLDQIDPIYYQKTYYLEPEELGKKPFALLMRALEESGRVAIAKVSLRQKEQLCTLRVYQNTIAMETMFYADEIRSPADLDVPGPDMEISDRELTMARSLIDMLTQEVDFASYKDAYREVLLEVIRKKAEGELVEVPQPVAAKVTDLMEALRASVEEARRKREAAAAPATNGEKPARRLKVAG
jgi:DNA end-binding protein Ku